MTIDDDYSSYARQWFGRLAPVYWIFDRLVAGVRRVVVEVTDAKSGSKVLDVATGTGEQAFAFAQRGYEVVGVDISTDMLRIANERNKYSKVTFRVADAANMLFEDDYFDVSCISFTLHDMPFSIRENVLREMTRVTRPRGTIIIVDYAVPANTIIRKLFFRIASLGETKYFPEFVKAMLRSDFMEQLKNARIRIEAEILVLGGFGRILRGINRKDCVEQVIVL